MAGLLAWAADVVAGGGAGNEDEEGDIQLPLVVFNLEQQHRALELDRAAAALRRSIQDLRLRIPPEHISQRLPHLHAHTIASSAALALQLNAHSTTREQAQLREISLQEENVAHEKAILNCQNRIQDKKNEAIQLQSRLKELDILGKEREDRVEKTEAQEKSDQLSILADSSNNEEIVFVTEPSEALKLEELNEKKAELSSLEELVRRLEEEWFQVQQDSIKQPTPAQREKTLEKQLHSLIEQLTSKQAQAEGLVGEIRAKEKELEKLNNVHRKLDSSSTDLSTARNRFIRSIPAASADYVADPHRRSVASGGRAESLQQLMLLRSAFVVYILALHVIVFIKISF
ncbi:hypothetical protein AXF42_Ash001230 [Apostasia shenzhenica]|uniref:Uncharacterized protein n=1 Tax=Apostasia shenzhenica TaxID=1088818 RepID=A0A2I0AUB5_9ASPA|nr:hypothetical protein AXF42_Ash001230 [Apostasia shenzhenica]